jgi:hypothetical protein
MPRRCLLETAQRRLPASFDDGALDAHRRRLLHRAEGRVLDLSPHWESNLPSYRPARVAALTVTGPRRAPALPDGLPAPGVLPAGDVRVPLAEDRWDTVVLVFALCCAQAPTDLLSRAGAALATGGQVLVLEHVAGTGFTAAVQHLVNPWAWSLGRGCRFDLDVAATTRRAGMTLGDCARFKLWAAATVPTPCMAAVLRPRPARTHPAPPATRGAR